VPAAAPSPRGDPALAEPAAEEPAADETGTPAWRFPANPHEFAAYVTSLSEPPESADEVRQRVCALVLSLGGAAAAEAASAGCTPPTENGG